MQLIISYAIGIRIEIINIAKNVACSVSDLSVNFRKLLENILGNTDVGMIVGGSNPQTENISAVLVGNILGNHAIAKRLGHLSAFAVNYPTVSTYFAVRSSPSPGNCGKQRGLEPAAVLVCTLKIEVRGPAVILPGGTGGIFKNRCMGYAGIKPNVHDVGFLFKVLAAAVRANSAFRQNLGCILDVPGVGTFLSKKLRNSLNTLFGNVFLAAILAEEDRDRNAPGSLTRDTPVTSVLDHADNSVLAPIRDPMYRTDSLNSFILKLINRAEPLFGSSEEDGVLTSPAMGILMHNVLTCKERTGVLHMLKNSLICFIGGHSCKHACIGSHITLVVNRNDDRDLGIVINANLKVFKTVSGSGMNDTGTAFKGYVVAADYKRITVDEGMLAYDVLKVCASYTANDLIFRDSCSTQGGRKQLFSDYIELIVCLNKYVLISGTHTESEVSRQSPYGGGPNYNISLSKVSTECGENALVVGYIKLNINGGAGIVCILDLSLCKSGLAVGAPCNGLKTLIDVTLVCHSAEYFDLLSFEVVGKGDVRIFVVSKSSKALKLALLDLYMLLSKVAAGTAKFNRGNINSAVLANTHLSKSLKLNRQTMGIPTGNIRSTVSAHVLGTDNDILKNLVKCSTKVNRCVSIWRAVMENESRLTFVVLYHLVVKVIFVPSFYHSGLFLRKGCAHREICFRQIHRAVIIVCHWKFSP